MLPGGPVRTSYYLLIASCFRKSLLLVLVLARYTYTLLERASSHCKPHERLSKRFPAVVTVLEKVESTTSCSTMRVLSVSAFAMRVAGKLLSTVITSTSR